jgi:hypothetical protein
MGRGVGGQGAEVRKVVSGQWSVVRKSESEFINHKSLVSLGDKFALVSGLLEITYNTGAKVLLQGPVTYSVEANGGYLAAGKLTGKLEKKSARSEIGNRKSEIPAFAVRTPTATVTDLGTEFGVEVGSDGATRAHVFRGSVELRVVDSQGKTTHPTLLYGDQSARIERAPGARAATISVRRYAADPLVFARQIAKPSRTIDLLDIVAGGNGLGRRRERGIDPLSGMQDPAYLAVSRIGDGIYHRCTGSTCIDGVFVLAEGNRPMQVDSAGHVFPDFPRTSGVTWSSIWARKASVPKYASKADKDCWPYMMRPNVVDELAPGGQGLLAIHPNAGITFDLEAIRQNLRSGHLSTFHAIAGKEAASVAEIWVLVDGRLRFKFILKPLREKWSGTVPVDIPLKTTDRFLTLVTTEGNDGLDYDWVVFGDPVLQVVGE